VFTGKPDSKRPLGRPRRRWKDNIKLDLRETDKDQWSDLDSAGSG
jgi:hypothetical protein